MLDDPPARGGGGDQGTGPGGLMVPRRWLVIGAGVTILLAVAAAAIGSQLVSSPSAPSTAKPKPKSKPAPAEPAGFVRFSDPVGRFSIAYPSEWRPRVTSDPQIRLLAAGDTASVLVRTSPLGIEVGPQDLQAAKRLTDNLVKSAGKVKLLDEARQVTLGGLSGYLYVYTFDDSATGQMVAHAHYFLFRGKTLLTIVLQAQPADRFDGLAPVFDAVGATFRVQPR